MSIRRDQADLNFYGSLLTYAASFALTDARASAPKKEIKLTYIFRSSLTCVEFYALTDVRASALKPTTF